MKKRLLLFLTILFTIILSTFIPVYAATKQEVLNAILSRYNVAGKSYRLPQKWINSAQDFLNNNELTSEQYDTIMWGINAALEVAREEGTTNRKKMSEQGFNKLMYIVSEVSLATDVDIDEAVEEVIESQPTVEPAVNSSEQKATPLPVKNTPVPPKKEESGSISKEISLESSGETIPETLEEVSGEKEESSPQITSTSTSKSSYKVALKEADTKASNHIKIAIILVVVILLINIFIICLLFKSKWNKILKYVLIVIFVLLTIALLVALVLALANLKRIRLMYRLYLMFN